MTFNTQIANLADRNDAIAKAFEAGQTVEQITAMFSLKDGTARRVLEMYKLVPFVSDGWQD